MLPGTYRLTVYKNEREVARRDVDVRAGTTISLPALRINHDPERDAAVWRIGDWVGTPSEFLSGDRVTTCIPPTSEWHRVTDVNSPFQIRFTLTRAQVVSDQSAHLDDWLHTFSGRPASYAGAVRRCGCSTY